MAELAVARVDGPGGALFRAGFRAMASPCEVLVATRSADEARAVAQLARDEALRIEQAYSRYRDDNQIHAINTSEGRPVAVDAELARLLDFAAHCHALSEGLFDVTAGVLRRAWRFEPGAALPTPDAVAALLGRVGWQRVSWRNPVLQMAPGMEIDLGGIGKEYAVDRALERVARISGAACLLNFGGDLRANRPPDGAPAWRIGVETDGRTTGGVPVIALASGACTTSGDTYRHVAQAGRRYGHILDPRTGWPVADAPRSVTVLGATCTETGLLSTLAMLMGSQAEAFLAAQGVVHRVER